MTTTSTNSFKFPSRALLILLALFTLSACAPIVPIPSLDKANHDAEVDRRCKIDGGIHVYEQVRIPKEKLDKNGRPINARLHQRLKPIEGEEYVTRWVGTPFEGVQDALNRRHTSTVRERVTISVVRLSDNKVLGEYVLYLKWGILVGKTGGTPRSNSYICPEGKKVDDIYPAIFIPY